MAMLFIVFFGFWIAITFQIVYYLHCHPSQDIRVCVTKKKEFHFIQTITKRPPTSFLTDEDNDDSDDSGSQNFADRIKKFHRNNIKKKLDKIHEIRQHEIEAETSSLKLEKKNKELPLRRSVSDIFDVKSIEKQHERFLLTESSLVSIDSIKVKQNLTR